MTGRKLSDEVVHEICRMIEEGVCNKEISKKYNVSEPTISDIRCYKTHTHITRLYKMGNLRNNLTVEEVHDICKMMEDGYDNAEICKKYNLSSSGVSCIRHGRRHKNIVSMYNIKHKGIKERDIIHNICEKIEQGLSNKEISEMYGLHDSTISHIRCGVSYRQISKHYNIRSRYLSDNEVHDVCKMLEYKIPMSEISRVLNIDESIISRINAGTCYKKISSMYNLEKNELKNTNDEIVHKICNLLEEGYKNIDIAIDCGVPENVVSHIRNGRSHTDISSKLISLISLYFSLLRFLISCHLDTFSLFSS